MEQTDASPAAVDAVLLQNNMNAVLDYLTYINCRSKPRYAFINLGSLDQREIASRFKLGFTVMNIGQVASGALFNADISRLLVTGYDTGVNPIILNAVHENLKLFTTRLTTQERQLFVFSSSLPHPEVLYEGGVWEKSRVFDAIQGYWTIRFDLENGLLIAERNPFTLNLGEVSRYYPYYWGAEVHDKKELVR